MTTATVGRRMRRGKSDAGAGVLNKLRAQAHHPSLVSIQLANVQSLEDELDHKRERITFQLDVRYSITKNRSTGITV